MFRGKNKAFTIVEIMLFLGISSAMILLAMISIGSKQQRVQFTDSMRSLQSFIETQVSATLNGVNSQPSDTNCPTLDRGGNSQTCVNLGRVLVLEKDSSVVEFRTLLGFNRISAGGEEICAPATLLECSEPEAEEVSREYNLFWEAIFTGGNQDTGISTSETRAFGFVRQPRSSAITSISYLVDPGETNVIENVINVDPKYSSTDVFTGDEVKANYCFESANGLYKAAITLNDLQVDLVFDPDSSYNC